MLTNLNLKATNDIKLSEVYPADLPDLFHGGQLVVLGRYSGKGPAAVKLTGRVGMVEKEFVYELTFPEKTGEEREFVEHLWARRKVGYLLEQIRANGEQKELVQEVVSLAKKYGITTPYTSYLVVPDGAMPVTQMGRMSGGFGMFRATPSMGGMGGVGGMPAGLAPAAADGRATPVLDFAKQNQAQPGQLAQNRGERADKDLRKADGKSKAGQAAKASLEKKETYECARQLLQQRAMDAVQTGKLGVDLSVQTQNLRNQTRLEQTAVRNVFGRNCLELGGVWIDEGFDPKMTALVVKAQSDAYFKLLERQPKLREVFRLGNHLVWVTPNGTALVIDTNAGKDKLSDDESPSCLSPKSKLQRCGFNNFPHAGPPNRRGVPFLSDLLPAHTYFAFS